MGTCNCANPRPGGCSACNPGYTLPPFPVFYPQGCICPPTSEQTCQSPTCPRRNNSIGGHAVVGGNSLVHWYRMMGSTPQGNDFDITWPASSAAQAVLQFLKDHPGWRVESVTKEPT